MCQRRCYKCGSADRTVKPQLLSASPPSAKKKGKESLCYLHPGLHALNLSAQAKSKLTLLFFFQFCVFTFKVRFWKKSARLHNAAKRSQLDESPVQVSFFFFGGLFVGWGGQRFESRDLEK